MGCASSKAMYMQAKMEGWDPPEKGYQRSMSMPLRSRWGSKKMAKNNSLHVVALTSSTYGALKMDMPDDTSDYSFSSLVEGDRSVPDYAEEMLLRRSSVDLGEVYGFEKKSLKKEKSDQILEPEKPAEVINVKELMRGLDDDEYRVAPRRSTRKRKAKFNRSISHVHNARELSGKMRFASRVSKHSMESLARKSRLNSQSFERTKGLFYGESLQLEKKPFLVQRPAEQKQESVDSMPMLDSEDSSMASGGIESGDWGSFDPNILKSIERVIEQLPAQAESFGTILPPLMSTVLDSPLKRIDLSFHNSVDLVDASKRSKVTEPVEAVSEIKKTSKKFGSSKVSDLEVALKTTNILEKFELKCPPEGEEKVVLYTTSLRGIRKTFEDCNQLRMVLQGFNVKMDERDVSMHSDFRQELKDVLGKPISVPRLFVKGRYIGGIEEAMQLNEDGALARILEGVPQDTSSQTCEACGNVRFVPCSQCSGSCKVRNMEDGSVLRCPHCNENGLIRCPLCC